jgi:hypothetical protein
MVRSLCFMIGMMMTVFGEGAKIDLVGRNEAQDLCVYLR